MGCRLPLAENDGSNEMAMLIEMARLGLSRLSALLRFADLWSNYFFMYLHLPCKLGFVFTSSGLVAGSTRPLAWILAAARGHVRAI
jgi:hypothetical protein